MTEKLNVLVVCLGNVCRSPMAERLLRLRFDELLPHALDAVQVSSAGVRALVGDAMDETAAVELRRLGGDPDGFTSAQVHSELIGDSDLVLTATRQLRSRVLEESPRALKRTFTIREFAALASSDVFRDRRVTGTEDLVTRAASWRGSVPVEEYDVADPIGQSQQVHREVADLLDHECTVIAQSIVGAILSDVGSR